MEHVHDADEVFICEPRCPGGLATIINESQKKTARKWVLALTSTASFMVALDALVVVIALSSIRIDLDASIGMDSECLQSLLRGSVADRRFARRRL
jgi:hypothetical protein